MCDTLKQIDDLKKRVAEITKHISLNRKDHSAKIAVRKLVARFRNLNRYYTKNNKLA